MAAMLLYSVGKFESIERISLRFFESNHGQSEGDSAHSAIGTAISQAGDVFVPSQLFPIFQLARRQNPYKTIPLIYNDFLDFKKVSKDLRILTVRTSNDGRNINWTDIMELVVDKKQPMKIFFKYSHLENSYNYIQLKRFESGLNNIQIGPLNSVAPNITKKKI
nr:unnamed protein product [Callosobruchus chinensis]